MKTILNIKPIYKTGFVIVLFIALSTWIIVKSGNSNKDAVVAISENNHITSQTKLDEINDGLGTVNENVKVVAGKIDALVGKIDALSAELGLVKEDIDLIQEDLTSLGLTIEEMFEATLIELEGIKSTVDNLKKQGYNNVTAKKVISYNRCVAASSAVSTCAAILD